MEPSSYIIQPNTLSDRTHWPHTLRLDPRFATHTDLEWVVEDGSKVACHTHPAAHTPCHTRHVALGCESLD